MAHDETIFTYHLPGYGSNVANVEASAIGHVVEDERMLNYFSDLNRCESLGNLWRIINGLKERGYKGEGNKNVMVIMGLGATGLPLAIIANHYGFPVIGIEQSGWRRETAKNLGVCDAVFENAAEAMQHMGSNGKYRDISNIIVPIMAGSQDAYSDAYALIQDRISHLPPQDRNSLPHLIVAFGLFPKPETRLELPGIPQDIGEREIVLKRHEYPLLGGLGRLVGMCGRLPIDWEVMMDALAPDGSGNPKNPVLVNNINAITHTVYTAGRMQPIADLLNDPAGMQRILEQNHAVKLAFSHVLPAGPSSLPLVV
ncbi:hypothetical protein HY029_04385 [Candidatus Gottesmanbacteria bacterium]|nr:hypothetical protein [Candidatus Gottesmanbacteria bacterium]